MKTWIAALVLGLCLCGVAQAQTRYSVYCANGKIEVDSRSHDQMRSARGSGICQFGSFPYLSDAQSLARRQFGGEGARCTCR